MEPTQEPQRDPGRRPQPAAPAAEPNPPNTAPASAPGSAPAGAAPAPVGPAPVSEPAAPAPAPQKPISPEAAKRKSGLRKMRPLFIALAVVVVGVLAARFFIHAYHYVETDDAYVSGHVTVVSSRINGTVAQVFFDENQKVKAGDLLVKIDPRDQQNSLDKSVGDLQSLVARQQEANRNLARAKTLLASDSVTRQEYDDALAAYQDMNNKLSAQIAATEEAKLNMNYSEVRAASDGTVGKRSVEPGQVVAPGQAMMMITDAAERWVQGNFKETQLTHMKAGQDAEITIDAVDDHVFKGKILNFSPGSGAAFALIPPDNATGNFTKIVQRLPVRVEFDKESLKGYEDRVVPGLSAIVEVKVR